MFGNLLFIKEKYSSGSLQIPKFKKPDANVVMYVFIGILLISG